MTDAEPVLHFDTANMPEVGDRITFVYRGRSTEYTVESVKPTPGIYAGDPPIGYTAKVSLYINGALPEVWVR